MKQMRMKPLYIQWTWEGIKTATTRLKCHPHEEYELISGSRYKPVKSGVKIRIKSILSWTLSNINEEEKKRIAKAENFSDIHALIKILKELNKTRIEPYTVFHTHFYELIKDD